MKSIFVQLWLDEVKRRIEGYTNALINNKDDVEDRDIQNPSLRPENRNKKRKKRQRINIFYNNFGEQFEAEEDNNDWEDFDLPINEEEENIFNFMNDWRGSAA